MKLHVSINFLFLTGVIPGSSEAVLRKIVSPINTSTHCLDREIPRYMYCIVAEETNIVHVTYTCTCTHVHVHDYMYILLLYMVFSC